VNRPTLNLMRALEPPRDPPDGGLRGRARVNLGSARLSLPSLSCQAGTVSL